MTYIYIVEVPMMKNKEEEILMATSEN